MHPSLKHLAVAGVVAATLAACGGSGSSNNFVPFVPPSAASNPPAPAPAPAPAVPGTVDVKLIAFNDLHGNLEPPKLSINAPAKGGGYHAGNGEVLQRWMHGDLSPSVECSGCWAPHMTRP